MSIFSRIKSMFSGGDDDDDFITLTSDVPLSTLARWYIYDTGVGNEQEVSEVIGLTPVSDEGHKKEQQDSKERLERLGPLLPFIDYISNVAADAVVSMQFKSIKETHPDELDEDEADLIFSVYKSLSIASLVGAFSIALDLRLVSLDAVSSDVVDLPHREDDDDE